MTLLRENLRCLNEPVEGPFRLAISVLYGRISVRYVTR